jgi:hypothetical protein
LISDSIFPSDAHLPEHNHRLLYEGVLLQLKKDFHPFSEKVTLPETLNGDALYLYTFQLLVVLLKQQPQALGALLYRVDLSEKKAREAAVPNDDSVKELAKAIVKREAQKVWYRQTYG